jgi:VanZ family protein
LISLAFVFLIASLDEWNQLYRTSRNGSWVDVGIDLVGGLIGILIYFLYCWRNNKKR